METLRERRGEAAIAVDLNRQPLVQSDLADVIKTSFSLLFFLGPIRPSAVGERVNFAGPLMENSSPGQNHVLSLFTSCGGYFSAD